MQDRVETTNNGEERASLLPQQVVSTTTAYNKTDIVHYPTNNKNELPQSVNSNDFSLLSSCSSPLLEDDQRRSVGSLSSSGHRKILEHIRSDSLDHRRHPVGRRRTSRLSAIAATSGARGLPEHPEGPARTERRYDWSWFRFGSDLDNNNWRQWMATDGVAGLSVGLLVVPQSLSYAALAGLPVQYGLYAAFMPLVGYAVCGTSRQLAVGPVALLSLLLKSGLTALLQKQGLDRENNDPEYQNMYNQLAIQCSLLLGIFYILMGLCRLGFVTIFLSHAVVSGFTTGAALLIATSQIKYLLGYNVTGDKLPEIIKSILANRKQWNPVTCALGCAAIAALLSFKKLDVRKYPQYQWLRPAGPLLVTATALLLSVGLQQWSPSPTTTTMVPVVGHIPQGLPAFTLHLLWTPVVSDRAEIVWVVLPMVIVGFMESIAIAKQLARKHKYEIDASTELIGLGMANFLGGTFSAFPVTGSFSRSAVNNDSGAQSSRAGLVTAALVGLTLTFLTPVFEKLPLFALAAIVISGVLGLVDYQEAYYLYKANLFDFTVWVSAFLGTLLAGVEAGLAIAVTVSLLVVLYESAFPAMDVLGRLPGTRCYRDLQQYPEGEVYEGILILSIRAPLYFANASYVRDRVRRLLEERQSSGLDGPAVVEFIILELSAVSHVDTTAMHQLGAMVDEYRSRGQELVFSNPSMKVVEQLEASGLIEIIGENSLFASLHDAVHSCLLELDSRALALLSEQETVKAPNGDSLDGGDRTGRDIDDIIDVEANHTIVSPEAVSSDSVSGRSLGRRRRQPSA